MTKSIKIIKKKASAKRTGRVTARSAPQPQRNIGDEIIAGLQEAIAFERGELPARVRTVHIASARHVKAEPAPDYTPDEIAAIRKKLELSQSVFARMLNISPETAKAWEQGKGGAPSGAAKRLLQIAEKHPDVVLELVEVK